MKRQGEYVKNIIKNASYKSFKPANLQDVVATIERDVEMDDLLIKVYENLAKIEKVSEYVKNTGLFLYAYVLKEALESSRIEGTECTMQDVLSDTYIKKNKKIEDIKEVVSNINAIYYGVKRINDLPLCIRLYKEIHKELLKNTRGSNKDPGEIRNSQNWIGGNSIETASFVPPNVDDMNEAINMLDKYVNEENDKIDKLINISLIHYQFETIHPFLDGNGRLGRIIILLYMLKEKLLHNPIIYLSYYLKMYQSEYYDKMMKVREEGKYEEYVKFFLRCMKEASSGVLNKIETLEKLHNENVVKLPKTQRKRNTIMMVFDYIEKNPIFTIKSVIEDTKLSFNTINTNINELKNLDIVSKYADVSRNQVFIYKKLYDIISA